jgi:hypothetical protein
VSFKSSIGIRGPLRPVVIGALLRRRGYGIAYGLDAWQQSPARDVLEVEVVAPGAMV